MTCFEKGQSGFLDTIYELLYQLDETELSRLRNMIEYRMEELKNGCKYKK